MTDQIKRICAAGYGAVSVWYNEGQGFLACLLDRNHNAVSGGTNWNYSETAEEALEIAVHNAERNPR